jgi:trans-aconitate 2-methyltransferase
MPRVARRWDARTYDSLALPHTLWGRRTLARLDPSGVSRVLDAGCGTGRDTELLLDLIPDVRVVAVDASRAMLDQLERRVADRRERVEIIHADLTQPLPIAEPVDAIISVAAFHWIADHATLFCNLAIVLRGGGQLVAECGGEGNIASIVAAIDDVLGKPPAIWNFAGVEETERRLADAGFTDIEVALIPDSVRLEQGAQFESYLVTLVLGAHVERLPVSERRAFIRAVIDRLSDPVVDHVRLTLRAKKRDGEGSALGAIESRATPPRLRR